MKNGEIKDFMDQLYYGEELVFEYDGTKYFLQGWTENDLCTMVLDIVSQKEFQNYLWKHEAKTMKECAEEFLKTPLWNGKVFPQIQKDVLWSDW